MRAPYTEQVTDGDVHAAALQYVRKVSGFRAPAAHNADAFNQAVDAITEATRTLLGQLEVRGTTAKVLLPAQRATGPASYRPRVYGETPVPAQRTGPTAR